MLNNKETSEGVVFTQNTSITSSSSYQNPDITYLDDLEFDCWSLFRNYCTLVGIRFDDDEIDFSVVKSIQERIIEEVKKISDIPFPVSKNN